MAVKTVAALPVWMGFTWPSIQITCDAVAIMAFGADSDDVPLLMRTIDLQSLFRMFAVADTKRWKVRVYAQGGTARTSRCRWSRQRGPSKSTENIPYCRNNTQGSFAGGIELARRRKLAGVGVVGAPAS